MRLLAILTTRYKLSFCETIRLESQGIPIQKEKSTKRIWGYWEFKSIEFLNYQFKNYINFFIIKKPNTPVNTIPKIRIIIETKLCRMILVDKIPGPPVKTFVCFKKLKCFSAMKNERPLEYYQSLIQADVFFP